MADPNEKITEVQIKCPACGFSQPVAVLGATTDGQRYAGSVRAHCRSCRQSINVKAGWEVTPSTDH